MIEVSPPAGSENPVARAYRPRRTIVFSACAVACVFFLVFVGFARTYYLRFLFELPPLDPLLQLHGALMTGWFVLFFTQIFLIKTKRIPAHRRMGWLGFVLMFGIVFLATYISIRSASRDLHAPSSPGPPPIQFMEFLLVDLLLFAIFVILGVAFRRSREYHMRFMLLACLSMSGPGIFRIPLKSLPLLSQIAGGGPYGLLGLDLLLLYGCVLVDTCKSRRLHPAFLFGGVPLVLIDTPIFNAIVGSRYGLEFGRWLVSFYS